MKSLRTLTEWFANRFGEKKNAITTVDLAKNCVSCVISLLILRFGHTFNYLKKKKRPTMLDSGLLRSLLLLAPFIPFAITVAVVAAGVQYKIIKSTQIALSFEPVEPFVNFSKNQINSCSTKIQPDICHILNTKMHACTLHTKLSNFIVLHQ